MRLNDDVREPVIPSESDVDLARKMMPHFKRNGDSKKVNVRVGSGEQIELPEVAVELLVRILGQLAAGNAVTLMPIHKALTTQEAADILGVSRPFVVAQMDSGKIPYRKVGTHRRVMVKDLVDYKRKMDAAREQSLDELAAEGQRLGLGY